MYLCMSIQNIVSNHLKLESVQTFFIQVVSSGATDEYVWMIPRQKNNTPENNLNMQWVAHCLTNSPEISYNFETIMKMIP